MSLKLILRYLLHHLIVEFNSHGSRNVGTVRFHGAKLVAQVRSNRSQGLKLDQAAITVKLLN
jgi:hypothetical protein